MAKSKGIKKQTLGLALIIGILIQFVFPHIKLGSLSWVGTVVILVVALYLLV